jgi:glycosyltransferase involved in cell wall biosynthesis
MHKSKDQGSKNVCPLFDVNYFSSKLSNEEISYESGWENFSKSSVMIDPNICFDLNYYINQLDTSVTHDQALWHYYTTGWSYGLDPHPLFNTKYYIKNSDFLSQDEFKNPLEYFLKVGWKKRHDPHWLFSTSKYLEINTDVFDALLNPLEHYLESGEKEGRQPHALFDPLYYGRRNPSISSDKNLLAHYLTVGYGANCDPHPLFDIQFYNSQANNTSIEPVKHYLTVGDEDGLSPHPLLDNHFVKSQVKSSKETALEIYVANDREINPNKYFDVSFVLNEMEKVKKDFDGRSVLEYYVRNDFPLKVSKAFNGEEYRREFPDIGAMNPLHHYIVYGRDEGRILPFEFNEIVTQQVINCLNIDADILPNHRTLSELPKTALPKLGALSYQLTIDLMERFDEFKPEALFLLSGMRLGGAELAGLNVIRELSEKYKVLVIFTDNVAPQQESWWADLSNVSLYSMQDVANGQVNYHDRVSVLANVLSRQSRLNIFNSNSFVGWDLIKKYGVALEGLHDIYPMLFCYDKDINFKKCGYIQDYLLDVLPYIKHCFFDNQSVIDEVTEDFGLTSAQQFKLSVLYQPVSMVNIKISSDSILKRIKNREEGKRPKVYWLNRVCLQKRPDILLSVVISMPDVDFHIWSDEFNFSLYSDIKRERYTNLYFHKPFKSMNEVPFDQASALLYTASWDGIPTTLINVMSIGIPIVAPKIGGIEELITNKTGWLVDDPENSTSYVDSIRELLTDNAVVERKLESAERKITEQHSPKVFKNSLFKVLTMVDGK